MRTRVDSGYADRRSAAHLAMESHAIFRGPSPANRFHRRPGAKAGDTRMSSVNHIGNSTPIQKVVTTPPVQKQVPPDAPKQVRVTDKVELSGMSQLLATLKKNDIRADKVAAIKAQIASGAYDADDKKLDAALDGLLDDLLK
jgi:anti-sigma28 factor (negative regulator of flagellin synthesis)